MIYINDIPSFRAPEKETLTVDDRQERIELINGVAVQDLGRVEAGDVFSVQCLFSTDNYARVQSLWLSRAKVTYTDESGTTWQNMRIIVKEMERQKKFPTYILVTFELWRA